MHINKSYMLAVVAFGIIVLVNIFIVSRFDYISANDTEQQIQTIEKAVKHAAVQCYALEGSYPGQVSYLEDHYGLTYDHERFFVHYLYESANFIPQIMVFETFSVDS